MTGWQTKKRVITSYSIHYTKLYEPRDRRGGRLEAANPDGARRGLVERRDSRGHRAASLLSAAEVGPVKSPKRSVDISERKPRAATTAVITSYSIHYTKVYDMQLGEQIHRFCHIGRDSVYNRAAFTL